MLHRNDYDKSVKTVLDDCKKQFKTPKGTKKYIKICIRHRENLSVYEYDSWSDGSNDFDVVMLKALLKGTVCSILASAFNFCYVKDKNDFLFRGIQIIN